MKPLQRTIYNCQKAQQLGIKKENTALDIIETIQLRIHIASCSVCKHFLQQSAHIDAAIKKIMEQSEASNTKLSNEKKEAIEQKIKELL
jgi:hypothetical protein